MKYDFSLYDTLFEAVLVVDQSASIIYYNHAFSTLSKASPRILNKEKSLQNLFHFHNFNLNEFIDSAFKSDSVQISEEIQISSTQDNEALIDVVIKATTLPKDRMLLSFNDISIEKKLYHKYKVQLSELKETHGQIIQADKLSTLGELTANISHEISNPLTIALGNIEVIEGLLEESKESDNAEILTDCIYDVKESFSRINDIIKNMKTFLHHEEGEKNFQDIKAIAEETVHYLSEQLKRSKVSTRVICDDDHVITMANRIRIEQVLTNLIKNSIDAFQEVPKERERRIDIVIAKDPTKGILTLDVVDNGQGITTENKDKIFNTFFTTKSIGDGTGLGLSLSQKIIEGHKGSLTLVKTDQNGTTLRIELPSMEILNFTQDQLYGRDQDGKRNKRILVIDDEVKILNLIKQIVTDLNYIFIGASRPSEALNILNDFDVDLIITDYNLPEYNADQLVQTIRDKKIQCPIIYLSSSDTIDYFKRDKEKLKIESIILKPFDKKNICEHICQVLQVSQSSDKSGDKA